MNKKTYDLLSFQEFWKKRNWTQKEILITGGTGSLGRKLTEILLKEYHPKGIRIFSRDEVKQSKMRAEFSQYGGNVAYLIGDVRDFERVKLATKGADLVIHAAAMKRIESCEENPIEAIQTNVLGSVNVLRASIDCHVERLMGVSTDKVAYNINLYGATKLCAEKLLINGNVYSQGANRIPKVSCCRYGNVSGSTGSVIPLFRENAKHGKLGVTSKRMTRFWITLDDAARFILRSIGGMVGQEIFLPKMPSYKIIDLAAAVAPKASIHVLGVRDGEKTHETILTVEESAHMIETPNSYVLRNDVKSIPFDRQISSANVKQLTVKELQEGLKYV